MGNTIQKSISSKRFALLYYKYGTLAILLVLCGVGTIVNPIFLTGTNISNVLAKISTVGIIACGQTMIIIAAEIDLSAGATVAFTTCVAATFVKDYDSIALGILVPVALGAFIGFVNGVLISKFKVMSFIITLATMEIIKGLALIWTYGIPIVGLPDAFDVIGQGRLFGVIPVPIIIWLFIAIITWVILNRTKLGRYIYAIGGNRDAALASGLKIDRIIILIYIIMGMFTALGGVVLTSRINSGQPTIGLGYEFDAIIAVIIGGTSFAGGIGNVTYTIIGCILVGVINNILNLGGVDTYWQQIVKGAIIALAVIIDIKTKSIILSKK